MSTTGNSRGFAFSLDLAVATIAMIAMLYLVAAHTTASLQESEQGIREREAMQEALFLADSMVKNRNTGEPLLGAALYSAERHRVESNVLDRGALASVQKGFMGASGLSFREASGEKETFFRERAGTECIAVERFVMLEGKKGLMGVRLCRQADTT